MKNDSLVYKFCITLAMDNAKKRIKLLEERDQKCILEEYKEWLEVKVYYQLLNLCKIYNLKNNFS